MDHAPGKFLRVRHCPQKVLATRLVKAARCRGLALSWKNVHAFCFWLSHTLACWHVWHTCQSFCSFSVMDRSALDCEVATRVCCWHMLTSGRPHRSVAGLVEPD